MNRRVFLAMVAAAIVPTRAPKAIHVREPYWTVNTSAVYDVPQRIVYIGVDCCSPDATDTTVVRRRVYQRTYRSVTASGETLASGVGR